MYPMPFIVLLAFLLATAHASKGAACRFVDDITAVQRWLKDYAWRTGRGMHMGRMMARASPGAVLGPSAAAGYV